MIEVRNIISLDEAWNGVTRLLDQPIAFEAGSLTLSMAELPADALFCHAVGTELCLVLAEFPFVQATRTELEVGDLERLPQALAVQVLDGALEFVRAKLSFELPPLGAPQPLAERDLSADTVWLAATLDLKLGAPVKLLIGGTRRALARAARRLPDRGGNALSDHAAEAVRFRLLRAVGALDITVDQMRALQSGDLLVPAYGPSLENQKMQIAIRRMEDGWAVKEITMADEIAEEAPLPNAPEPLASLDDLPVRLSLVIGDVELSLAQLRALSPEALLALSDEADPLGSSITILANGKAWGKGELVDVDGQLATRVTQINTAV